MAEKHRKSMRKIKSSQKELVKEYFSLLSTEDPSSNFREVLLEKISESETKKITLTYQHFEELKSICTDEQLQNSHHLKNLENY